MHNDLNHPHVHYSIEHSRIRSGTMDRHLASPSSLLPWGCYLAFRFSGSARSAHVLMHHPNCLSLFQTPADIQSLKTVCYQHVCHLIASGSGFIIDNCIQLTGYFYLTVVYSIYRYCETELVVFDRERADHLYVGLFVHSTTLGTHLQQKVFPWVISEIVSNLPVNIGFTSLFATILYFMCNFRTDNLVKHLFVFIAECSLVQLASTAVALIAASLVRACKPS